MTSPSNSRVVGAAGDQVILAGYLADNPNLRAGALSAAQDFLLWAVNRQMLINRHSPSGVPFDLKIA